MQQLLLIVANLPENYVAKSALKQTTGTSTTDAMSQKAITDALGAKADKAELEEVKDTYLKVVV